MTLSLRLSGLQLGLHGFMCRSVTRVSLIRPKRRSAEGELLLPLSAIGFNYHSYLASPPPSLPKTTSQSAARSAVNSIVRYKQPRSIQVVIFADQPDERKYLLLRRVASYGGFWQTVTGSLEENETHRQAAVREVLEETGIVSCEEDMIDLGVVNTFEIAPRWRDKYPQGVTHNEEVCFALKTEQCEVRLDPIEHDAYAWKPYDQATRSLYWESSKRALAAVQRAMK